MPNREKALITGATGHIGSAIARQLIDMGYDVINIDQNMPAHDIDHVTTCQCSIQDYDAIVNALEEELGAVDSETRTPLRYVVCVAGGTTRPEYQAYEFAKTPPSVYADSININLVGNMNAVHASLPYLRHAEGDKSIIMISSINGWHPITIAGYSAAKAGMYGFMNGVIHEFSRYGIRMNLVSPGTVPSPRVIAEEEKDWDAYRNKTTTGEFTTAEDIALTVRMLLTNKSIVGQNIIVDAGQTLQW